AIFFKDSGFEYVDSRRNIVTQGVELMWLIGREFQIGKARFLEQHYCDPCLRPSHLSGKKQKFLEAFLDRGGLVAGIIESGTNQKAIPSSSRPCGRKHTIIETVKPHKWNHVGSASC